ncbi:MAG: DUF402 domain-containing protein [Chloroflexi bacterium OHK40]
MITVRLIKPLKGAVIAYEAEELCRDATSVTVRAPWTIGAVHLGLFSLEPGDTLIETYYTERWYNIFDVRGPDGRRKGWYCNVTRPARIGALLIESEDLELDLLVAADRSTMRLDDEDEFAARNLEDAEPAAYAAALAAVAELRALAARGEGPFGAAEGAP